MFDDLPDSVRRCVRPEVRAERAYHVGGDLDPEVKLNQNESPYDLPRDLKEALLRDLVGVPFNRYPTEQPDDLAAALSDHTGHPASGLLIGNGSNELTYTLGLTFVSPGAAVVLPRPMFALYGTMVRLFGGVEVSVPPRADLVFDAAALLEAVHSRRPVLTVLTTPNNPTGLAMAPDDIEAIVAASDGIVLVDEAYVEFNPHGSVQPLLERYPNVLIMRTLSKAFGLAGLRIGYLLGHPGLVAELLKARLPFMVDRLAAAAAMALLKRPELVAERVTALREATDGLYKGLSALPGVQAVRSATNFLLFHTPLDPTTVMGRLASRGVLVRNMGGYPELMDFLRVSAGTDPENRRFLAALEQALLDGD